VVAAVACADDDMRRHEQVAIGAFFLATHGSPSTQSKELSEACGCAELWDGFEGFESTSVLTA
jgi:hypothetical protein